MIKIGLVNNLPKSAFRADGASIQAYFKGGRRKHSVSAFLLFAIAGHAFTRSGPSHQRFKY